MIAPLAIAALIGCSGDAEETTAPPVVSPAVSAELLAQTWQLRMVDAQVRSRFESSAGWGAIFRREHAQALRSFREEEVVGRARVHVAHAAFYRQALLLYANATHHVYGPDRQETDPIESDYLLGVSEWVRGDSAAAAAALAALSEEADAEVRQRAAWWAKSLAQPWPLDIDAALFPAELPAPDPALLPALEGVPHYAFTERSADALTVETTDPTTLLLLSRWHEQVAVSLLDGEEERVQQLLAPWRLPIEPAPSTALQPLDDGWLFASFLTTPADAAFLAEASAVGIAAVQTWQDRSVLAATLTPTIVDGVVATEEVFDASARLEDQLLAAMAEQAGLTESFHQGFAALARVGVIRAGMVVADAADQYRDAGILRLSALEQADGPTVDPIFSVSVAAWDAGNRNPVRAQELVHHLLSRFPSLSAARYPLDALHIRRGRNAGPSSPVH